jgi:hypothetical protein
MPADPTPPLLPDYFALMRGMLGQGNPLAGYLTTDPAELERRVQELEVVVTWLKAQTSAVEVSIQALRVQREGLKHWQKAATPPSDAPPSPFGHPAGWLDALRAYAPPVPPAQNPRTGKRPSQARAATKVRSPKTKKS